MVAVRENFGPQQSKPHAPSLPCSELSQFAQNFGAILLSASPPSARIIIRATPSFRSEIH